MLNPSLFQGMLHIAPSTQAMRFTEGVELHLS
jgi:hypothetical protein